MDNSSVNNICRVAVDAMGGDYAPQNIVLGAIDALKANSDFELILVGKTDSIEEILEKEGFKSDRLEIVDAQEVIEMSDNPTSALKAKKNSSIVIGSKLVKDKKAHAFVSAGNTGAMMAASTLLIGRIKGVSRPTIGANIPNSKGRATTLFDVGASIESKPNHLLEQAILGSIFVEELQGLKIQLLEFLVLVKKNLKAMN